ncbi:MAG: hypothetical protein C4523_08220 [Myxococcales bacterium]|nr:MAG: hypothetical protein C4523_08220 [Myxococcales bacterium]
MPAKTGLCLLCLVLALGATTAAQAAEFNSKYAAPFGQMPDARVENYVRFSYLTEQGKIEGVDKPVHGGYFAIQLAMEDAFSFELATIWKRMEESYTTAPAGCTDAACQVERRNNAGSSTEILLTPKYRFLNLDWVWGSVSATGRFPLQTQFNQTKRYGVEPGFQFYFDTGAWFGVEMDVEYLLHITDPEESPYAPGYVYAPQDDEQLIHGIYARANFLLKIIGVHFVNLQAEDTFWLRDFSGSRTAGLSREDELRQMLAHAKEPLTENDKVDLTYFAKHQLNVGGGYRVNLKVFEGGIGGWYGITDSDKRQPWGVNLDTRFTF